MSPHDSPLLTGGEIWVRKWVDYSSKYGLGYILTSNATGVFFNDSTKIAVEPGSNTFYYMERGPSGSKQDSVTTYSLVEYPKDL
jgi:polo-like kinase 1